MKERSEVNPSSTFFQFSCPGECEKEAIKVLKGIAGVRLSPTLYREIRYKSGRSEIQRVERVVISGFSLGTTDRDIKNILKDNKLTKGPGRSKILFDAGDVVGRK